jgi:acetyl esterase/lipase
MGASVGATLAVATTLRVLKEPGLKPNGLIAVCAFTVHPDAIPDEYKHWWRPERFADSALLTREVMNTCSGGYRIKQTRIQLTMEADAYGAAPDEPQSSILLHPDLAELPKTWLVACTKDPTLDEMMMFHDKLKASGVDVRIEFAHGYPHFFWMLPMLQRSQELMDSWTTRLREMISDP